MLLKNFRKAIVTSEVEAPRSAVVYWIISCANGACLNFITLQIIIMLIKVDFFTIEKRKKHTCEP